MSRLQKGGRKKGEGGYNKFLVHFNTEASSFSHTEGVGAQKVSPYLNLSWGGGGGGRRGTINFPIV